MMIKIGENSFDTAMPADLNKQLLAATGCSAAEVGQQMRGLPLAGYVARALHPLITGEDRPDLAVLTDMIAAAGTVAVAGEVGRLYAAPEASEPAAPGAPVTHEVDGAANVTE